MFKEERCYVIINLLIKDNSVSVSKFLGFYKVSQEIICFDLCYFQKLGMFQCCYGGGILNCDVLSKFIIENKIDIFSIIVMLIYQDVKLCWENIKKVGKVCVLGLFNIDVLVIVLWFL